MNKIWLEVWLLSGGSTSVADTPTNRATLDQILRSNELGFIKLNLINNTIINVRISHIIGWFESSQSHRESWDEHIDFIEKENKSKPDWSD